MAYEMKSLSCDPSRIKGMSERLIVSHYENNYGSAVKRLNLIQEKLSELDYANAPGFLINGLRREELIAMNSMILNELFFDASEPGPALKEALTKDFGSVGRRRSEFIAMGKALAGGSRWVLCPGRRATRSSSIGGLQITSCSRARHVRALLSHRFWGQSGWLRRRFHERDQLAEH
jgi:superoxide dismutase